jgi:hypothetical protein
VKLLYSLYIRFEGSDVDVIGLNETFLTQSVSSKAVEIVRYRFLRNDRSFYGRPGVVVLACILRAI